MSETLNSDHDSLCPHDRGQFRRHVQHLVVVGDEPVPAKMVQCQEQGPIVSSDSRGSIRRRLFISMSTGR
jgi:hypothetical protein